MDHFATTHWSLVLAAGKGSSPSAKEALSQLCETYWLPIYFYVRRQGYGEPDAEDLTQEFFARLIGKNHLESVRPDNGRFRAYVLTMLKHFLSDERDRFRAQKRGDRRVVSLDARTAEQRYVAEPTEHLTPERIFERQWAVSLLDRAFARLEEEFAAAGKRRAFDVMRPIISRDNDAVGFAGAAKAMGVSEAAAKMTAMRMRRRYREILREEAASTLADRNDVDGEIQFLLSVLST